MFAAGAGPGSGAERKLTLDRDGAIKLLEAAVAVDATHFRGEIPREDVAAVIDVPLLHSFAERRILYVNAGETAVDQAPGHLD